MSVQYTGAYSSSMKADTVSQIPSKPHTLNVPLFAGFSLVLHHRTSCVSPIYDVMSSILETSAGVLIAGVTPADCVPDDCEIAWLDEKLKSRMLPSDGVAKIIGVFTLLIKPLRHLIEPNFLFFGAFSASSAIWATSASAKRTLVSCEAPARRVLFSWEAPVGILRILY